MKIGRIQGGFPNVHTALFESTLESPTTHALCTGEVELLLGYLSSTDVVGDGGAVPCW